MLVDGHVLLSRKMREGLSNDNALQQVVNVAHLPGIRGVALAMPDIHLGYGFPIGGVAATNGESGVVSPGGIGYDINCGVRLLRTDLTANEVKKSQHELLVALNNAVPSGIGSTSKNKLTTRDLKKVLKLGARWAVQQGHGCQNDLAHCENSGQSQEADPAALSERALRRGQQQLGTLGSGNHFLELQEVEHIYNQGAAALMRLEAGSCVVMLHTGSRGLGHQVCEDTIHTFSNGAIAKSLPDRQLCCAQLNSPEGQQYIAAQGAAANFAWANRQFITGQIRQVFSKVIRKNPAAIGLELIQDVSHNIGRFEKHQVESRLEKVFVHRKGATRALPPGHHLLPDTYRQLGQPVIIPGDMGRYSYLLNANKPALQTFLSCCHGAGRQQSRRQATKSRSISEVLSFLEEQGVEVMATRKNSLLEEAPWAYKDVNEVVQVIATLNIAHPVVRLKPFACLKG